MENPVITNEMFLRIIQNQSVWCTAFKSAKKETKYQKQREEKRRYLNKIDSKI